jgi:hypothetical protein
MIHPAYGYLHCENVETRVEPLAEKPVTFNWTIHTQLGADRKLAAAFANSQVGYSKLIGARGSGSERLEIVPVPLVTQTIPIGPYGVYSDRGGLCSQDRVFRQDSLSINRSTGTPPMICDSIISSTSSRVTPPYQTPSG